MGFHSYKAVKVVVCAVCRERFPNPLEHLRTLRDTSVRLSPEFCASNSRNL